MQQKSRRTLCLRQGQAGLHNNPVVEGFVHRDEDYIYSSAIDYRGGKGLLDIILIE